ncbi:hypothetical protein [Oerskovia enterophila]|uniref:NnrS protein n=1 Tax=Oerskovia enterophila TaxID=43678 RepID=A0A163SDK6_9CELL|nr:hypothetical protein [Oerskovia enterophila]KZM36293.1 hypothetical protein OJAG_10060 [Oerskovia enterophila]OCI29794.1 hypothetical protein OERS_35310 [Oerskovia enterophila]
MRRVVFVLPAGLALLAGLDAALLLLGLPAPLTTERLPQIHGVLLVLGFVGTVIALERAVALRTRWGFAAPGLLGAGALALLSPAPLAVGQVLLVAGCGALCLVYVPLWRRQHDDAVLVQLVGALLATGGALLWLGGVGVADVLPWLACFVVTTIAGERLELARIAFLGRGAGLILWVCWALAVGCVATLLWPAAGYALLGAAVLVLCGWLAVHDVARRTVRSTGLARYMAACLLAAYAWLAVAGAIWLLAGRQVTGPGYDAVIHAVFLGFTISMIMAHAPVILPAVLRVRLPYTPLMYGPAVLLHLGLLVRLGLGDARDLPVAHQVGGVLNVVALLAFVVLMLGVGIRARLAPAPGTRPRDAVGPAPSLLEETAP